MGNYVETDKKERRNNIEKERIFILLRKNSRSFIWYKKEVDKIKEEENG